MLREEPGLPPRGVGAGPGPRSRRALASGLAAACLVVAGCAALPWPREAYPSAAERTADGFVDLRGVVHVHTQGSHDSPGSIAEVVAAARAAGVRWVAITEHSRPGVLGAHGVIDGVTVIPGFELRAAGASLLVLGVAERPPPTKDPAALVRWTRAAGGVAVVGHFEHSGLADPAAFEDARPDAVEIANLHANARERRASLGWRVLLLPAASALRTLLFLPEANLARWEALPGPPPIVASVDAHAKFRLLGSLGGTVDRYRDTFGLLTTHVLARDASQAAILAALREGRSYVAFEGLAPLAYFRFEPAPGGFALEVPRPARLALVCGGAGRVEADGPAAVLRPPAGAARCRAEARLGDRVWALTSYRALARGSASAREEPGLRGERHQRQERGRLHQQGAREAGA